MSAVTVAALAGSLVLASCGSPAPGEGADRASDSVVPHQAAPDMPRAGIRFDPATIAVGQRIGSLTVDSVSVSPAFNDTVLVGTVRFDGELTLTGSLMAHFDAEPQSAPNCFEADSTSAARMPRWAGDERRPWFCFRNREVSLTMLDGARSGEVLTVTIQGFTIHRGFSDQVNAADLVARRP